MSEHRPDRETSEADGVLASRFVQGFGRDIGPALEKRKTLERKSTRTPAERARKAAAPRKPMTFKFAPETIELLRRHSGPGITMTDIAEEGIRRYVAELKGRTGGAA